MYMARLRTAQQINQSGPKETERAENQRMVICIAQTKQAHS